MQNVVFDGSEIRGASYYQNDFTEFSSNEREQKGYYLAVNVTDWNGAKFRIDRTSGKGTEVAFNGDGIAVLFLGATPKEVNTAKSFVYITAEGEETSFGLNIMCRKKGE